MTPPSSVAEVEPTALATSASLSIRENGQQEAACGQVRRYSARVLRKECARGAVAEIAAGKAEKHRTKASCVYAIS